MKFQFEFYYYKLAAKVMTAKTNKILGKQSRELSANNSLLLCCDKPLVL